MPDEDEKVEEKKPEAPVVPAFNAEEFGKQIAAQTAQQVAQALQSQPQGEPAPAVSEDALEQVLSPYINRATGKAALIAQLAADKADFYTVADPDELEDRISLKDEIERRTLALAQAGRAMPRKDIYDHLKGGEKFDEFADKKAKRKAAREKRALEEGADHGGEGAPRFRGGEPAYVTVEHAHDLQGKGKLDEFLNEKHF